MKIWNQLFPKQEANPPKSLVGCGVAYLLLLILSIVLMYLFGAGLRSIGGGAPATTETPQVQELPQ